MSVPVVLQVTPLVRAAAFNGARTLTFPNDTTAGSTIIVAGAVLNGSASGISGVIASVSMEGAVFSRRHERSLRWEDFAGLIYWTADNVAGEEDEVVVTPALSNGLNNCALFAVEIGTVAANPHEGVASANAEHGVNSISVGPVPANGSLSQGDVMAIAITYANQGGTTGIIGWQTPSGWSDLVKESSHSSALRPIMAVYRTQTGRGAISATLGSSNTDAYGRAAILAVIRGNISPPAPGPGPSPEPPPPPPPSAPPAQAVKVEDVDVATAGVDGVIAGVYEQPTDGPTGDLIFEAKDLEFVAEGGKAVLYIPIPSSIVRTTSETLKVVAQRNDGSAGFRGAVDGEVVEL